MEDFGAVSVLPPLIALTLALWTKQVYLSLFVGIWLGETALGGWSPVAGLIRSMDGVVGVFADEGRTKIILLSAIIGAFLTFTQYSGGTAGFVKWLTAVSVPARTSPERHSPDSRPVSFLLASK